jgi:hypothetical protein
VTHPENIASWRVLEKAGMRYVGISSYCGLDGLKKYVADRTWRNPSTSCVRAQPRIGAFQTSSLSPSSSTLTTWPSRRRWN